MTQEPTTPESTSTTPSPAAALSERLARHKLLIRGESLIGSTGIATAIILLTMVSLAAWWTARGERQSAQIAREQQIRLIGNVLARSAESMLVNGDLSPLRRLLIEAGQQQQLSLCRIVVPDGRVIADADPKKITLVGLPDPWPSGPVDALTTPDKSTKAQNVMQLNQPLLIRGRGAAMLQIQAPLGASNSGLWQSSAGVALIGAAALAAMLLVYRHMRAKVVTLGLIRESLLATQDGNALSHDALALREDLGPEAAAWNHLLAENQTLRRASIADRVNESLARKGNGGSAAISRNQSCGDDPASAASAASARSDLEHACDALSVGMIIVDETARVKHANGAAAVLLQAKRDQMLGRAIAELVDDPAVTETIGAIITGSGQRRTFEIRRSEEQGGGILRVHLRPMRREDAGGALVTIEDVTQQRVADAARNSFVAQATHELRTPLTNMRLCLEDALEDVDADPKKMRDHFNVLNQETRRLERMVGEMLSVAEIEAGSLQLRRDDVRLDKLFDELQADYKAQALEKKIELLFDLPPKFPLIQADRDKLMVALHNLLGNAMKYTTAGGKVSVCVRADAGNVSVDIADTGIGISPEEQSKLFQKFYRAKDPRVGKITGTGLGLALARDIARLHGGDISVQAELNKGSTFTLTLPIHAPPPALNSPPAKAA